jgi:cytochrome c oxidase subunit II
MVRRDRSERHPVDTKGIFGTVFGVESVIAAFVFLAICAAVAVALLLAHRRRKQGRGPSGRSDNRKLEIAYGLVVAAVSAFVVWLSIHTTNEEATAQDRGVTTVRVTGFQWCWRFDYPGDARSVTGRCRAGHLPTMVLPVGVPVTIETTASDVIHSWFVPHLRYKMDAFPDHTNRFTITVTSAGRWRGRCAEYCGNYHWTMDFWLRAVPKSQYDHWLAAGDAGGAGGGPSA